MKRKRFGSPNPNARKVACTVSAAALMLGVSQAATVGLHFQLNYCADARYTGFPVTMTAFGISTNGWENLTEINTGYGCAGVYVTLNEIIDTTTSTGGLNPLPNGSINVTWSANMGNFSGFAGYGLNVPSHAYDGAPPVPVPTGEWQIYNTFLRDGVNFGPPGGPDNNQNGYVVDITGLKTLFTNTPFAVQLIASSDSMQKLTNAFIIDATLNVTQSVVYPSTPPVFDEGSANWVRGHGGGLSTASSALSTDHLQIIGNRAAHGGDKITGFDNASTISGFIITDKPVISMPPQPAVVCGGDTVTWSGYAVGVPPLSYQWRRNGAPIPGATAAAYSITNVSLANVANYDMVVTNLYGRATSSVVTVDTISTTLGRNFLVDSNPQGPEHDGLNLGASWLASSTDSRGTNRTGVMSFNAAHPDQIVVPGATNFDYASGTIMFWMRSSGLANTTGKPAALFDRLNNSKGCVLVQNGDGTIRFSDNGSLDAFQSTSTVSNNNWHHIALTFNQAVSGQIAIYIDGVQDALTFSAAGWAWQPGQELEFGLSHDTNSWQAYNGLMDDVRVYSRALTDPEIASASNGSVVDTTTLTLRLNFDTAPVPGVTLHWKATDALLQGADVVTGPYTDISGATSPYSISAKGAKKFFRYHGHTPTNVVSNPYLM
ncbi:MAG TPA: LamG-like jellyroll fold domain-containing protein [Candidatus Acidoferrum sp.]|jgi:hypothetical protein|nr:LamG-like jellyroll fold domain-containing protein [Candidatus Acidoferrum sp.]